MRFFTYDQFNENEDVHLSSAVNREYVLTHYGDSRFNMKSDNVNRDFSVTPFEESSIDSLKELQNDLYQAIDSEDVLKLYDTVKEAEKSSYKFGNVFPTKFTLSLVPELRITQTEDDETSKDRDFLMTDLNTLPENSKKALLNVLKDRAEQMFVILTALFYFIDSKSLETHFQGKNIRQLVEEVTEQVTDIARQTGVKIEGPFSNRDEETPVNDDTTVVYWHCELDNKPFQISAKIAPAKLNKGEGKILFSLDSDDEVPEEYQNFEIENLGSKIKQFING